MAALSQGERGAITNELHLIRDMAYSGLTALRRAGAQSLGSYYEAFFALTVSLERAAKLALAVDARLSTGSFPSDAQLRKYGHDLVSLVSRVEDMATRRNLGHKWQRPIKDLDSAVLDFLNEFASASKDRYYNLSFLGEYHAGHSFDAPPAKWMTLISAELTVKQLTLTSRERGFVASQVGIDHAGLVIVMQVREDGSQLSSLEEAAVHSLLNERVQRVGVMACIQHLRYAAEVLRCVGDAAYNIGMPDVWDFFTLLLNSDSVFRRRRTFK